MKIISITLIGVSSFFLLSSSCKKKNDCEAGTDGSLNVKVFTSHHDDTIPNKINYKDTVYLKFCTLEQMDLDANKVPTEFDAKFIGSGTDAYVNVTGMKPGEYYFFVNAYDTTGNYRVFGGVPFSTEQSSGEVNLYVPVSEVH